jgi:hypothetical protein
MFQDTARVVRDTVADTTAAVSGHHFGGWWVAVAVVIIAAGVFVWKSRPVVVDEPRNDLRR